MFEDKYGQNYGDMPIDDLMALSVEPLLEMVKETERLTKLVNTDLPVNTGQYDISR